MESVAQETRERVRSRRSHLPIVVLGIAVAAAACVVAWLAVRGHGSTAKALPAVDGGPALVSQAQLERLAGSVDHPVYWAGPKSGYSYELTNTSGGRIFVRYLPTGVRAGDPRPSFLVVGTYTQPGGFADLKRVAKRHGSVSFGLDGGGLAVFNTAKPTSVYFGYPGKAYQVEVYSPSAQTARSLVLAGKIAPIR
ncbi:MAG TPA: hypothetical protein VLU96_13010 [Gaiellaceae bacterium]|nr:hypothetical protein [Gaiellaceae bacterium]